MKESAKTGKVRKSPHGSVVVPPPPSLTKATKAAPTSSGQTAKKTALQTRPSTADQLKTVVEWLDADDGAPVIVESLFGAIERVNAHAQRGDEAAIKDLIAAGNIIARYLFLCWAGPGSDKRVPTLRRVAAKASCLPVSVSMRKENNVRWKEMIKDLGVGSEQAERIDNNAKARPDVIDAIVESGLSLVEYLQNRSSGAPIPDAYCEIIKTELVWKNARAIAVFLATIYQESDPSFAKLRAGETKPFSTRGRAFSKRIEEWKKGRENLRKRDWEKQYLPANRHDDPKKLAALEREMKKSFNEKWDERDRKARAELQETAEQVQSDFIEVVQARLKTRLKAPPEKLD